MQRSLTFCESEKELDFILESTYIAQFSAFWRAGLVLGFIEERKELHDICDLRTVRRRQG